MVIEAGPKKESRGRQQMGRKSKRRASSARAIVDVVEPAIVGGYGDDGSVMFVSRDRSLQRRHIKVRCCAAADHFSEFLIVVTFTEGQYAGRADKTKYNCC